MYWQPDKLFASIKDSWCIKLTFYFIGPFTCDLPERALLPAEASLFYPDGFKDAPFSSKLVTERKHEGENCNPNHIFKSRQIADELWMDQSYPKATVVLHWSSQSLSSTFCSQVLFLKQPPWIQSNMFSTEHFHGRIYSMLYCSFKLPLNICFLLLTLPAGWSNLQTDTQTRTHKQVDSGTDLCDLCRGRHPWSQDGQAVICSPWCLEDEEDE